PSSKWVSEASDTAQVNFPKAFTPGGEPKEGQVAPTTLNLDLSPTKAFKKEVQKQVEAELKKCFDNKSIEPKCDFIKFDPSEIPVGGSDKKLDDLAKKDTAKWDMKEVPKVKASFGAGDTNTGSFFTEKPGKFDFTVDGKKAGSSYFSNGNSLSVSGSVTVDGDKLSVELFDFCPAVTRRTGGIDPVLSVGSVLLVGGFSPSWPWSASPDRLRSRTRLRRP